MTESTYDIRILEFYARVVAPPELVRDFSVLFRALPSSDLNGDGPADTVFRIEVSERSPRWYHILRDATTQFQTDRLEDVLPYLEWALIKAAIEELGQRYLLLHAGAVAYAGAGLVLPAESGSGKTTLTGALIASGFEYLGDEVAPMHLDTLKVASFPRSLCLKQGGRGALLSLFPELMARVPQRRFSGESVWYLRPGDEVWCSMPVPIRYVVLPRYELDGQTELLPVPRSQAVQHLLMQSFNGRTLGVRGVAAASAMLQGAECYSLTFGNLSEAVQLLADMVAR